MILRLVWRHRIIVDWLVVAAVLVAATAVVARERWLWRFDLVLYDTALALWARPAPDDVVIVAIDDLSIAEIGRWPWRRAVHATLLERLGAAGARAVALDLILTEPDLRDPASDAALAEALRRSGRTVLPVVLEAGPRGMLSETLPVPAFAAHAAALGHISIALDGDGVARSVYLEEGLGRARWPHLSGALLQVADPARAAVLRGERNPSSAERPGVWIRDRWMHIAFAGPPGHFRQLSYVDVLRGDVRPDALRDKLVLVGMTATGAGDAYPTPRAAEGRPMPGVEIVAHVLDALISGIGITTLQGWAHWTLSALAVAVLLVAFLWLTPLQSLAAAGLALVFTVATAALAARYLHVWVAPSAALAGMVLCYPLWSWRRLEATQRYLNEELARLRAEPGVLPEAGRSAGVRRRRRGCAPSGSACGDRAAAQPAAVPDRHRHEPSRRPAGGGQRGSRAHGEHPRRGVSAGPVGERPAWPAARRRAGTVPDRGRALVGRGRRRGAGRASKRATRTAVTCCSIWSRAPPTTDGASDSSSGSRISRRSRRQSASARSCCASSPTTCVRHRSPS